MYERYNLGKQTGTQSRQLGKEEGKKYIKTKNLRE
jgi:hypothetical protein